MADALLEHYYDSMYDYQAKKSMEKRGGARHTVPCESGDALANARRLLEALAEHYPELA